MAEAPLRLIAVAPGGRGLESGLQSVLRHDTLVTAYDDSRLRLASDQYEGDGDVEFVPFGDLLVRVLGMMGEPVKRLIGRGQREAVTLLACRDLDGDTPLEVVAPLPGAARLIGKNLEKLRHFGIESDMLENIAGGCDGDQASRFAVLAEVGTLVRDSMDASRCEYVTDRVKACLELSLPDSPLRHVVLIAGPDEQPVFDQWPVWLARQGVEVDVITDLIPGRPDLFLPSQSTAARLGSTERKVSGERLWFESLFSAETTEDGPEVEVFSAADPLSEAEWVLRRCARRIEEGVIPERIGIFVRDQELYSPLLVSSAAYMGVTLDASRTTPLLSCGLSVAVRDLLIALASRDVRETARLAGTSYCPAEQDMKAKLRAKAIEIARSSADPWADFSEWVTKLEGVPGWLVLAVEWRSAVVQGESTLSVWLERFRQLIGGAAMADASVTIDDEVRSRDLRAQTVLQRSIADFAFAYDQAGGKELSFPDFVSLATSIWEDETITTERLGRGVKLMFNADALGRFDTLFVPGMLEGSIPKRRREDPLLSDLDLEAIGQTAGVRLPNSRDEVRIERDQFVRLCVAGERQLVLSFAVTEGDRENVPAYYIEEVKRCLRDRVVETSHPRADWIPREPEDALESDRVLRAALDAPRPARSVTALTSEYAKEKVRPDWNDGISLEELATATICPFQAAYRFRLNVRSPDRRVGISVLHSLPRRARLIEAANQMQARSQLADALDDLLDRYYNALRPWELELLRSTGQRLIGDWVDREFSARDNWPRDEGASIADAKLGEDGLRGSIPVGGRVIRLQGKVAGLTSTKGLSITQIYSGSHQVIDRLDYVDRSEGLEHALGASAELLVLFLNLMVQHGRRERGVAIEFDSVTDKRTLLVLAKHPPSLRANQATDLYFKTIQLSPSEAFRVVKRRAEIAVDVLEKATAQAVPGEHCAMCSFSEICRSAPDNVFQLEAEA